MRRAVFGFALLALAPGVRPHHPLVMGFAPTTSYAAFVSAQQPPPRGDDLDGFMEQVLARRDDNWKKLRQYVLDEQERAELSGPGELPVWGEKREYTWYVRDGYFIRSPVRFNGVSIGESDRQKYEDNFLKRAQERDKRGQDPADGQSAAAPASQADVHS